MSVREPIPVSRSRVLAYRAWLHFDSPAVLGTGVQDTPAGTTAHHSLRVRALPLTPDLVRLHSLRGTMHLHPAHDVDLLAAALRPRSADELAVTTHGPFFTQLPVDVDIAFDDVAAAMRAAASTAGAPLTKGTLSAAVTKTVDRRLTPWCDGCGVHHVHDGMFRLATLQAGLWLTDDGFVAGPAPSVTDPDEARRALLRRCLTVCGPASPSVLAVWAGVSPAAARRWWSLLDTVEVSVEGRRAWVLDPEPVLSAPPPDGVRLLAPYDPLTELADRELVAPDPVHRGQIWKATASPGTLLVDGELAGVWRQKSLRRRLTIRLTTFGDLPPTRRALARDAAEAWGAAIGAEHTVLDDA